MNEQDLETTLYATAQQIYEMSERRIQPSWPWILVRIAPKEQKFGSLFLPDNEGSTRQNKPLMEGIVLETWLPHWSKYRQEYNDGDFRQTKYEEKEIWRESEFLRGDRILFPSHAGLPVSWLDSLKYRLVREWTFDPHGGAVGRVAFDGDISMKQELERVFANLQSVTLSGK